MIYEPWDNRLYQSEAEDGVLNLHIEKGNMLFVIFGEEFENSIQRLTYEAERRILPLTFDIAIMEEGEQNYRTISEGSPCFDISAPDKFPEFSGFIRYTTHINYTDDRVRHFYLDDVADRATVYIDGKYIGCVCRNRWYRNDDSTFCRCRYRRYYG